MYLCNKIKKISVIKNVFWILNNKLDSNLIDKFCNEF